MSNRGWQPWEYGVLREKIPADKKARLLKRPVEEVNRALRARETSLEEWYARRRRECQCHGAPAHPRRLLRLGKKILRQDFRDLWQADGWEWFTYQVLDHTLRHFDPDKGPQDVAVQERFVRCFKSWLRQHLRRALKRSRQARARGGRSLTSAVAETLATPARPEEDGATEHGFWSAALFRHAVQRLDPRARACLRLRLKDVPDREIAQRLGLAPKTLSNRYSRRQIVELVQRAVRDIALGLPVHDLQQVVRHLLLESGLSFEQAARLLCLPTEELRARLLSARTTPGSCLEAEEVLGLLAA